MDQNPRFPNRCLTLTNYLLATWKIDKTDDLAQPLTTCRLVCFVPQMFSFASRIKQEPERIFAGALQPNLQLQK